MTSAILIQTTGDDKSVLQTIAANLVSKKLAACCQISGPCESIYMWKGQLESSSEWICTIKTIPRAAQLVQDEIKQVHNYELPEIIQTAICGGSKEYLEWIENQIQPDQ